MMIALISPPWPLFNRPSIQIGALKAWLKKEFNFLDIKGFHPYVNFSQRLGFSLYHKISLSSWAAESVASSILYPQKYEDCKALFYRELGKKRNITKDFDFDIISDLLDSEIDKFINSVDFSKSLFVGFSICLNQFTTSLLISKRIKRLYPTIPIVFGGPGCANKLGESILNTFKWIDYIILGEGELPLSSLVSFLLNQKETLSKAVLTRDKSLLTNNSKELEQVKDLNRLPFPDFDDYFMELLLLPPDKRFFPVLPIEGSRGCWWQRCRFCNLNLQWRGYRAKSAKRISDEVDFLSRRYGVLDFAFMDNALPKKEAAYIFDLLKEQKRDYKIFCELRAVHKREEFIRMSKGGLSDLQVGIESLSPELLSLIGKGVKVIDNFAAIKNAYEAGITLDGNLIFHFPGSNKKHVDETLKAIEFLLPFTPLKGVSFWLGLGSPIYNNYKDFGIKAISAHPNYSLLFPEEIKNNLTFLVFTYKKDRKIQYKLWKPVEKRLNEWAHFHKRFAHLKPFLSFRKGADFIYIRQVTEKGLVLHHKLKGPSMKIYLTALDPVHISSLIDLVPNKDIVQLKRFIDSMVKKRLMYLEGDKVLSLAICSNYRRH